MLEVKIKELEDTEIKLESKMDIIREILKDIDENVDINLNKYSEDLEYIETEEYTDFVSELNKLNQASLSFQLLITLRWTSPFIALYTSIVDKNYDSIGLKSSLSILGTIILTLSWRSYSNQKDKKIGGTFSFILGSILAVIWGLCMYAFIEQAQKIIFVPDDYLMYMPKEPYIYVFLFFEIEILAIIIAFLYKKTKNTEWEWGDWLFDIMKRNFVPVIGLNIILLYIGITGVAVVTETQITDYSFYNPMGTEYTYDDITKINVGFIGKEKKLFREEPGDFYYIITLKDGKEINFYQSSSEFEDTYLELEIFDKLIVDIAKVKKIASKENYKLCYLDKRYVDRFLRIIEN